MKVKRMLPTIAALVALGLTPALPVRAESLPADGEQQTQNPPESVQLGADEGASAADSDSASVQALTPPAGDDTGISAYPRETPGYESGQTRLFGTGGGQ
jgi:hypothetical protein